MQQGDAVAFQAETLANIEYASHDGVTLSADLYRPAAGGKAYPLLIGVHGGGWERGDRKSFRTGVPISRSMAMGCWRFNIVSPSPARRLIRTRSTMSARRCNSPASARQSLGSIRNGSACSDCRPAAIWPRSRLLRPITRVLPAPILMLPTRQ